MLITNLKDRVRSQRSRRALWMASGAPGFLLAALLFAGLLAPQPVEAETYGGYARATVYGDRGINCDPRYERVDQENPAAGGRLQQFPVSARASLTGTKCDGFGSYSAHASSSVAGSTATLELEATESAGAAGIVDLLETIHLSGDPINLNGGSPDPSGCITVGIAAVISARDNALAFGGSGERRCSLAIYPGGIIQNPLEESSALPYGDGTVELFRRVTVTGSNATITIHAGMFLTQPITQGEADFTLTLYLVLPPGLDRPIIATTDSGATIPVIVAGTHHFIRCPQDITADASPGVCGATVGFPTPIVITDTGSQVTIDDPRFLVRTSQPAGSFFPIGTTWVICSATDGDGCDITCNFRVTVRDVTRPEITYCPSDITLRGDAGSATVDPGRARASDDCSAVIVEGVRSDGQPLSAPYLLGTTTITWTATDAWGNRASCRQLVTIESTDSEPPTTTATVTPGPNLNGWNNSDVSVGLSAVDYDGGTGVTQVAYKLSGAESGGDTVIGSSVQIPISAEGVTTLTYSARDNAGNQEAEKALTIRIDRTPPTLAYTGNAGTYTVDQLVNITCTATDDTSGIASHTCQDISGPAFSFPLGIHNFSATAVDKAGNEGSGATSFTVQVTADGLGNLTTQWVTDADAAMGLVDKLKAAEEAAVRGNNGAKANIINAFVNQVSAQIGKSVTAENAAILIRLARAF
jgi:hypothetical protein